jgi:hypothetical protein
VSFRQACVVKNLDEFLAALPGVSVGESVRLTSSTEKALGAKSSLIHSLISSWRSCPGSAMVSIRSQYSGMPPQSSGGHAS